MGEERFTVSGDPGALDDLYRRFLDDPHSVPRDTARSLARILETDERPEVAPINEAAEHALIQAYRDRGHLMAQIDPLGLTKPRRLPELEPGTFGLGIGQAEALVRRLKRVYCGPIGWEFAHVGDRARRAWLQDQAESDAGAAPSVEQRLGNLDMLWRAQHFEDVLRRRLPGTKQFGLSGAESYLVAVEAVLADSARAGVQEVVMGGLHRGRFTLIATVFEKPLPALISEIMGRGALPPGLAAASDVPYHLGYSCDREIAGRSVHLTLSPHPSHLQVVGAVTLGRARAKQSRQGADGSKSVLPLLAMTDAGFAGQGIMAEIYQLSDLPPFTTGGTVALVLNNQIGFTTGPEEGRSSHYCTDVAKIAGAPVLHVNGDDPDAVYRAATVAARYRAAFQADIVVDIVGYRRLGHNEVDEPRFTQPEVYRAIDARAPVGDLYAQHLKSEGVDTDAAEADAEAYKARLKEACDAASAYEPNSANSFQGPWSRYRSGDVAEMTAHLDTGLPLDGLVHLAREITSPPKGFELAPKVGTFLEERRRSVETGESVSWATAEALALASLLRDGMNVRLGGQDTPRGAFTQRHAVLHDQASGARHTVFEPVATAAGARAEIFNTPLAEYAVLAFEYGHSLADPDTLVVWEAQFGDFLNVAQPVFDQFIVCGEDRWLRRSGLVLLLPHGLDGGGPDHATARPDRLLAACADGNIQVVNATTPANYFHLLRRQMHWPFRKPLAVLAPKWLLRHKACVSPLADFGPGTGFRTVIGDEACQTARRVVLCTGKIYYELAAERAAHGLEEQLALIRLEQLYPVPDEALRAALDAYPRAELIWCQEEPANMGYFDFLRPHLEAAAGRELYYAGRPRAATPAVGLKARQDEDQRAVIAAAIGR